MPRVLKKDMKYVQIKSRADFYDAGYQYVYWRHKGNNTTSFIINHIAMDEEKRGPIMHRIYDTVMPADSRKRPSEKELEKCCKDVTGMIKKAKGDNVSDLALNSICRYIYRLEECFACSEEASHKLRDMIPDKVSIALKFPVPFMKLAYEYLPKYKINHELKNIADKIDTYCNAHKITRMREDDKWWEKLK